MLKKLWYSAVLAGVSLFLIASGPAQAHSGHGHAHGHRHYKQHRHYRSVRYYRAPVRVHRHYYKPVVRGRIVVPTPRLTFRIS